MSDNSKTSIPLLVKIILLALFVGGLVPILMGVGGGTADDRKSNKNLEVKKATRTEVYAPPKTLAPALKLSKRVEASVAEKPKVRKLKPEAKALVLPKAKKKKPKPKEPALRQVVVKLRSPLSTAQRAIDSCRGAVLISGAGVPLVAQHDYCGGTGQLGSFSKGARLRLTNAGSLNGVYQVSRIKVVPKGSTTAALKGMGSVVLQTCKRSSLLLTGLTRVK